MCSSAVFCSATQNVISYIFHFFLPVTIFLSHPHSPSLPEDINPKYAPKTTYGSLSHPSFPTAHIMTVTIVMEDGVTVDMCAKLEEDKARRLCTLNSRSLSSKGPRHRETLNRKVKAVSTL